jgi:hypothetical protein
MGGEGRNFSGERVATSEGKSAGLFSLLPIGWGTQLIRFIMAQASTNETEYIVGLNNNPRGPFNREDLVLMARGGLLNEKTRVFVKGWEKWKTMSEVEALSTLLAENAPTPHVAAAGPARLPDGWDTGIQSSIAALQLRLDQLSAELIRRTDQLGEGQKISVEAVADGQGVLTTVLAEMKSTESVRNQKWMELLAVSQEKNQAHVGEMLQKVWQDTASLLEGVEKGLAAKIQPLEIAQIKVLEQLEQDRAERLKVASSLEQSFGDLQNTLSTEREKEITLFSERIAEIDQRLSASLGDWAEQSKLLKSDLTEVQAGQHLALLSAQSESTLELVRVREGLEKRISELASERRLAGEESVKMWAEIERRLMRWDEELPKQLQTVVSEIQNTPGRLDGLFTKLEQDQRASYAQVTRFQEAIESRLGEAEAKQEERFEKAQVHHDEQAVQWEKKLDELKGQFSEHSENFGIRMDAQLRTLQASSESRSAALAAELETRSQKLGELLAVLKDGLKESEDISLERYSVLLAAADDQRALPERLNRQLLEISENIKTRLDASQKALEEVVQAGSEKTAGIESRLADLGRVQAERMSEELASVQQDQLRRLQESDDARHQQFMALSQAFNGMVAHLDEELPAHLAKMEAQLQAGLDRTESGLAEVSKAQSDSAREATAGAKAQLDVIHTIGNKLASDIETGRAAQQAEVVRLLEHARENWDKSSNEWRGLLEVQARELRVALDKWAGSFEQKWEAGQQLVGDLGRQQVAAREAAMQSLANLGGWTQSLHEKLERGLALTQTDVATFKTEVQGQMAGGQEALQARIEGLGRDLQGRQQTAQQALDALEKQIPQMLHEEVRAAVDKLDKRLAETQADMAEWLKEEGEARGRSMVEFFSGLEKFDKRLVGTEEQIGNRVQAEGVAREKSVAELLAGLGRLEEQLVSSRSELGRKIEGEAKAQIQTAAELSKAVGQIQQTQAVLQKTLVEEIAAGWAKRWTVLNADLAKIQGDASTRQEELAGRLAGLESKIPAAMAEQFKMQSQNLQAGLAGLSQVMEIQQKRVVEIRQEMEKQMALHFAVQQKSTDQLLKLVQEDVARMLGSKFEAIQKDVTAIKTGGPATQKTLVEELHKAVARLPDHLTESYRVTNNAMQKQLAEMAQEVSAATQQVEQSRAILEKTGVSHLASLQEASESSRQQAATAIREAKDERQHLYTQLFQELKNWQLEQKKILAVLLKGEKRPADGESSDDKGMTVAKK